MKTPTKTGLALLAGATLAAHVVPSLAMPMMPSDKMMMPMMETSDKMMMDKMMMDMSKDDQKMMNKTMMMSMTDRRVMLKTSPPAAKAGLQNASGFADVNVERGMVEIVVTLPPGTSLPAGTALEGWLSTAGNKGGPGPSTASMEDQKFGPAFGMEGLAMESRDVPYALSTGLLRRVGQSQTYYGQFMIDNSLAPYAAVAVTLETDGNTGKYDPRPGSPFMAGMIGEAMMMGKDGKMMMGMMPAMMPMMGEGGMMMDAKKDKMMAPRLMMMTPDGKMMAVQMYKGKMMMSMPNKTMAEVKMMNGKMMMPTNMGEGKLMMVMPDGSKMEVKMMDDKMMVMMEGGKMAEVKMMDDKMMMEEKMMEQ